MSDISRGHIGVKKIVAISRYVAVQAQAWVTQNLFGVQGVVHPTPPNTTHILRTPLTAPILRTSFANLTIATNLLITTLAVVTPPPFAQADFQNPLPRPIPHTGFAKGVIPQPVPFAQSEWPNPVLATPRQQPANSLDILRTTLGPAPTKTATLQDTFNAGHDTALWDVTEDPGSTVTFIRNRVEIQAPTGLGDVSYGKLHSKSAYDLIDSSAHVEVVQPVDAVEADIAGTGLSLILNRNNSTSYALGIAVYPDYTLFYRFVNGTYTDSAAAIPYDPVAHRWLRIRHSGTTVYWDTSADGVSWTNRASWVPSFYVGALYVELYSGLESSGTSPTLGVLDNFNTGADPFAQFDWANPLRPRILTEGFSGSKTAEAVVVAAPFTQTEWPNPVTPRRPHVGTVRGVIPQPVPFTPLAFPNPAIASRSHVGVVQGVMPQPVPFTQTAWANPVRARAVVLGWEGAKTADVVVAASPFAQGDWPNPILRTQQVVPIFHRYAGEPVAPAVAAPFAQDEFPNPVRRIPAHEWGQTSPQVFNTADVPAVKPFNQNEQPNPLIRKGITQPEYQATVHTTLTVVVIPAPFVPVDFPNPIQRRESRQDWQQSLFYEPVEPPAPEPPSTFPDYPIQPPKVNYNTRGRLQRHQGLDAIVPNSPFRSIRGRP